MRRPNWATLPDPTHSALWEQSLTKRQRHSVGKGQCGKISPGIVQMELHTSRRDIEKLRNILHRLAVERSMRDTAVRAVLARLPSARPTTVRPILRAHMRMIGETHHLQHVLRGLDETIESKAAVVHRQRERRELVLA